MKREFKMRSIPKFLVALFVATLVLFAGPAQVFAAAGDPATDPTASQYDNPGSTITQDDDGTDEAEMTLVSTSSGSSGDGGSNGSLPFTGFDAGVLAIVAVLLGATGLALRRFSTVK